MSDLQKNSKLGKAPLNSKGKNIAEFYTGAPASDFDVPANCLEELRANKLAQRWIDINQLKKNGNRHRQGWVPYKFKCLTGSSAASPFSDGAMDGFLTMRGMVLSVKTDEMVSKQKEYNRRKVAMQSNSGKAAIEAFKEFTKDEKSMKVHTGYEDNED